MAAISVCEMSARAHQHTHTQIKPHSRTLFFMKIKYDESKKQRRKNDGKKLLFFCDHINGQVLSLFFLYFGALNHNKSGEILIQMYTAVNYVMSELQC